MTIPTAASSVVARGNGVTTQFDYDFLIPAGYAQVTLIDPAGVQSVLPASAFTIVGEDNPDGGYVQYPTVGPAIALGYSLVIRRVIPYTQPTRLSNQGGFYPEVVESALDWLAMQIQQGVANVNLGIHYPSVDVDPESELPPAAARAGKFFGFDGNGDPTMLVGNLLAGDLLPYTVGGAAWTNPNYATMNMINFNAAWGISFATALVATIYGLTTSVSRTGGAGSTVGAQFDALSQNGVNTPAIGAITEAWAKPGATSAVTGFIANAINETNNNTAAKYGLQAAFGDRPFGAATVTQALGANEYNLGSAALYFSSQSRSTAGEFCGWRRGIYFDAEAMDADSNGGAIGIDFAKVHYYGGANPLTAFRMTAAIRLRDYQSILWNGDPTLPNDPTEPAANAVRTFFSSGANRIIFSTAGVEMFGISVTTGDIYKGGVLITPVSTASNNTWTGTNTFTNTFTLSSDLIMTGGVDFKADFSNATIASRSNFMTTTAAASTDLCALPSVGGAGCSWNVFAVNNPANSAFGRIAISGASFAIQSSQTGAAAALPMTFACGAAGSPELMRLSIPNGQFLIATATESAVVGAKLRVNGIVQIDNNCAISVNRNGVNQGGIANNVFTKVQFTTKRTDQNGNFDNAANFRWTPPAGCYLMTANAQFTALSATGRTATIIYKNGAPLFSNNVSGTIGNASGCTVGGVDIANGTDFYEVFVWHLTGGVETVSGLAQDTFFTGSRLG
jgi:hypothetical protein